MRNKRPKTPYKQTSPELDFIPNMKEAGCNFMAELYGIQEMCKTNFSAMEIYSLVKYLQQKNNPSPNSAEGEKCLTYEMNLRNPDELINKAFEMLGKDKTGRVNWGNEKDQKPEWTIIKGKTDLQNDHFKYGDSNGSVLWDPYDPELDITDIEVYNVYIFEGKR